MNYKELLELAAKAADIPLIQNTDDDESWYDESLGFCIERKEMSDSGYCYDAPKRYWNPLINDGDAFRLAVKLEMFIQPLDSKEVCVWTCEMSEDWSEDYRHDRYAATRRAIVRAAAGMAESK